MEVSTFIGNILLYLSWNACPKRKINNLIRNPSGLLLQKLFNQKMTKIIPQFLEINRRSRTMIHKNHREKFPHHKSQLRASHGNAQIVTIVFLSSILLILLIFVYYILWFRKEEKLPELYYVYLKD